MKSIFIPGIKLINRLKYPQKFILVGALIALVLGCLLGLYIIELDKEIAFVKSQSEILDVDFTKRINKIKNRKYIAVAGTSLVLLILVYIFSCFTLSIVNAVKYLENKALKVAAGNLDVRSELNTNDELKTLSNALNQMVLSLKTFTSALTHDLRSPILAEQKAIEFLLTSKKEISKEQYNEYLKDLYTTNEEQLLLINNTLELYQSEIGKWKLAKTKENLLILVNEVENSLKYLAEDKNSKININIPDNLPLVCLDKIEIKRVFSNLVSNAIKHNEKGVNIWIGAEVKNNNLQVFVKDNGKGIPKKTISNIFEQYYSQKGEMGSGLGLYISKQIIKAHDGEIWLVSEEGKGTTFFFTLPL